MTTTETTTKQIDNSEWQLIKVSDMVRDLAERTIKAKAWDRCSSLQHKRGGNPFEFAVHVFANRLNAPVELLQEAINIYIEKNPMRYYPTSKRLEYTNKK